MAIFNKAGDKAGDACSARSTQYMVLLTTGLFWLGVRPGRTPNQNSPVGSRIVYKVDRRSKSGPPQPVRHLYARKNNMWILDHGEALQNADPLQPALGTGLHDPLCTAVLDLASTVPYCCAATFVLYYVTYYCNVPTTVT